MEKRVQAAWSGLEQRIGHRFSDRELLARALTHRSYANENRHPSIGDNERLEFLGDAVLDLIVGYRLYVLHAEADEGTLSRLRAELVSAPSLARLARELALGDCLLLGRGEDRGGGRDRENLQADGLEALIGAIFLDAGYAAAEAVVGRLFAPFLQVSAASAGHDFKTRLQEYLQAHRQQRPEYRLIASHGPDHQRHYEVEVLVDGVVLGRGEGTTKKRAEQEAACYALEQLACQKEPSNA
jgi:ribonuclease-3